MSDSTLNKIDSHYSPKGDLGQKYLASGKTVSMRLWEKMTPEEEKQPSSRDYETVGFVLDGSAKLHLEDQVIALHKGDSWLVPKGASHWYEIEESFSAVEATSPPAQVHGRDISV